MPRNKNESQPSSEDNSEGKEKYELGDVRFLFEKNNPTAFAEKIVAKGLEVMEDSDKTGERITKIDIPKGEYIFGFGFRQIDPTEKRWFHGGLDDTEKRESASFKFDINSPEFKKIHREFASTIGTTDNLDSIISKLNIVIQQRVKSSMATESAHSLSEIIQAKKAACASKTILAGSMLREQFPDFRIEAIDGYYGVVKDKVCLPFEHGWLRVSDGISCVLYDPMYDNKFYYQFDTKPKSENPFSRYTVSAYPFARLHNSIGLTAAGNGIALVESYEDSGKRMIVQDEYTVKSQLGGHIAGQVRTDGGILELVNGNLSNEIQEKKGKNGPRMLYPLVDLEKLNF